MRIRDLTIEQRINTILLIWSALLAGVVVFAIVAVYMVELDAAFDPNVNFPFVYITPPLTLILAVWGRVFYEKKTIKDTEVEEADKAIHFQTNSINKFAIWEGAAFLNIITYMLTQDTFYLILLGAILVLYLVNYPSRERFRIDYNVN